MQAAQTGWVVDDTNPNRVVYSLYYKLPRKRKWNQVNNPYNYTEQTRLVNECGLPHTIIYEKREFLFGTSYETFFMCYSKVKAENKTITKANGLFYNSDVEAQEALRTFLKSKHTVSDFRYSLPFDIPTEMTMDELCTLASELDDFRTKVLIPGKDVKSVERPQFLDQFDQAAANAVNSLLDLK